MELSEHELRAMVREAIARHSLTAAPASPPAMSGDSCRQHASHGRLPVFRGSDDDGPCLIEPVVRCSHCSFCQSFGH